MNNTDISPQFILIAATVAELARDSNTREVWLIGSRANGIGRSDSDWDLLVFSDAEIVPILKERTGVDVLRVGPTGKVLLDGQPECNTLKFADFQWVQLSECESSYVGKKLTEFHGEDILDNETPRVIRSKLKALLVWSRGNKSSG